MEGLQQTEDERAREMNGTCEFSQPAKISQSGKFPGIIQLPSPLRHLQNRRLKIVRKQSCK